MTRWRFRLALLMLPLLAAVLMALACVLLIPPAYTARISITAQVPLARLPMYGALLKSRRLADRVIDHFGLQTLWREPTRHATRERLADVVRVGSDRSGMLVIEVDAPLPWLAADIAAFHVQALQSLVETLRAETRAERRQQLATVLHDAETAAAEAREALLRSGIDQASLRSDAGQATLQLIGLTGALRQAEVRLAMVAQRFAPGSADFEAEAVQVAALRAQLARLQSTRQPEPARYAMLWREQQRLERLLQRLRLQDEQLALDPGRTDEALLLVERATLPERAGRPRALLFIAGAWGLTLAGLLAWRRLRSSGTRAVRRSSVSPA